MSHGRNVFAVARSIWDDSDFASEPFTEREAFMWLVSSAAWKDIRARGNAGAVDLKRGEFSFATRFLAEKWQWSKSRVDRFIQRIENRGMIRDTSRDSAKVYSVSKYNYFQVVGMPKRDSARDSEWDTSGTEAGHERDKEETGKQDNRETKKEEARSAGADAPIQAPLVEPVHISEAVAAQPQAAPDLFAIPPFLDRRPKETGEVVPFVAPSSDLEKAVEMYNLAADFAKTQGPGWTVCMSLTPQRRAALKARMAQAGGLLGWKAAMKRAMASSFLLGLTPRGETHTNWRPSLKFFLQQESFTKLLEGGFDDTKPGNGGGARSGTLDRIAQAASRASAAGGSSHRTD